LALALVALQHLPERRDTLEQAIDLRFDLRTSLFHLGEFAQIFDHLREAEILAEALGDQRRLARVSDFLCANFNVLGDHERAIQRGERALDAAAALGIARLQRGTNFHLGAAHYSLGDYRRAIDILLRRNVEILEGEVRGDRSSEPSLRSVVARTWLVWSLAELGEFAEGISIGEEGVRIAEAADRPDNLINAYAGVGLLYLRKGDLHQAIPMLERGFGLWQVWHIPLLFPLIASALGAAYTLSGRATEALPLLEQAVGHAASMSVMDFQSLRVAYLGEAYLVAGRMDDARALAVRAHELSREHKERGWEAYALRLLGEIAAQRDPPEIEPAEAYYRQACTLADELGMRPLVAHCHLGLGTLYGTIGRVEQARAELSAAVELYRVMEMTLWLPRTEAALAEVRYA